MWFICLILFEELDKQSKTRLIKLQQDTDWATTAEIFWQRWRVKIMNFEGRGQHRELQKLRLKELIKVDLRTNSVIMA